ncbi:signal peptide peptidase A. Serine peptidase. MEROPS family S49 [Gracilibacillus ureilyticus]|uniref:Signal peptide peptidase A. Serine peptidase. MEROPS family S49 n=1 Tax=Gracilibacillus ureilyticus TaxID=531814 RepID=A0A1H9M6Y8_9BACI|nr:signal peptide peptidase SppA [Gracilibacillus ureilyticus]SER19464.1 signal peptide peptidase A. Serine peptidase. MEROPS family S49 [Gracilibacillus ureilyticus]
MNTKRWVALIVAIGLFLLSVGFQFMSTILSSNMEEAFNFADLNQEFSEKVVEDGSPMNKIAVLHLNGVIQDTTPSSLLNTSTYNHQRFLDMLENAGEDNSVKGIVLHVNTPGGGVVESAEIHDKILEIKEEYEKPVYVSMGNTAASGGYYVSAPADKIVAHKATLTGSIGVIMESINFAELADEIGIDFNTIKSGEHKDILSSSREMTEEERAILQAMIDDMYADFVDVIVQGRGMDEARVRELGDGRVYTGSQAVEEGLVDEIGSLDDTIAMLKEDHDLSGSQVIEYENGIPFGQFLGSTVQSMFGNDTDLVGIKELVQQSNAPRALYLYSR